MKGIWEIICHDFKMLKGNFSAIVIVLALALLPSMYAWFNIVASWDPYGNTGQIKVAVVNEDVGATLEDKKYTIGTDVIDELKTNDQMDWQFVSAEEALNGLNDGSYYASLTLPTDFSEQILSITTENVQQAKIIYTSNQKINAIAPKITEKGATALQEQINQTVVGTITQVLLETAQLTSEELQGQLPKLESAKTTLTNVKATLSSVETTLASGETTIGQIRPILVDVQNEMPQVATVIDEAIAASETVNQFVSELTQAFATLGPQLTSDLQLIADFSNDVATKIGALAEFVNDPAQKEVVIESLKQIQGQLATTKTFTDSMIGFVTNLQTAHPNLPLAPALEKLTNFSQQLDEATTLIDTVQSQIANGETIPQATLTQLSTLTTNVAAMANELATFVPNVIIPGLDQIVSELGTLASDVGSELAKLKGELPAVNEALASSLGTLDDAQVMVDDIQAVIPEVDNLLTEIISGVTAVQDSSAFELLERVIGLNVDANINFLENPVEIETVDLYPVANYGSAMTPFYTILSLWVGSLLLVSILTVERHDEHSYRPWQIFFGKYAIFGVIAIIQSLIVTSGDIWLLGVQTASIPLFISVGVLSSLIFSFFIYSCVSVFGAAGKVIGIILLVLQIAGSGGTFPIQLTPDFFQALYPFMPFTYAISAMRETVGGIVWPVFWNDLIILGSYFVGTLAFALTFKKAVNHLIEPFAKRFKASGLGE